MSMSRRANAGESGPMASVFKTLNVGQTSRYRYETSAQARRDVVDWIDGLYHRQRIHSSTGSRTPVACEAMLRMA